MPVTHFKNKPIESSVANKIYEHNKRIDVIKNTFCVDNKINLLRIPYWEIKNVEKIIIDYISNLSKNLLDIALTDNTDESFLLLTTTPSLNTSELILENPSA